ncbi:hypothetical protein PMAC_001093 [Pneumocystis sp. 'macacae']|nr:hypothetical protein PMAC_001093 [Pneumocystis sp. 'macacae']
MWYSGRNSSCKAQTHRTLQTGSVSTTDTENSVFNAHIYAKDVPLRRTYLRRAPTTHILADKSNTVHSGTTETHKRVQETVQAQGALEREKTGQTGVRNEVLQKKGVLRKKKEYCLENNELQKVAIPISKLRKKNNGYNGQQKDSCSVDGRKKRNLSSITTQNGRTGTKNNPHIDINDLPANILDDLSFQHLSLDGEPVATSTPKEKKKTNGEKTISEKPLAEVSPLALPALRCEERGQKMRNEAQQGLGLKKLTKDRVKMETNKMQTKYTGNRLKKSNLLVKRLPKPITCNSSLDDEIITTFS